MLFLRSAVPQLRGTTYVLNSTVLGDEAAHVPPFGLGVLQQDQLTITIEVTNKSNNLRD